MKLIKDDPARMVFKETLFIPKLVTAAFTLGWLLTIWETFFKRQNPCLPFVIILPIFIILLLFCILNVKKSLIIDKEEKMIRYFSRGSTTSYAGEPLPEEKIEMVEELMETAGEERRRLWDKIVQKFLPPHIQQMVLQKRREIKSKTKAMPTRVDKVLYFEFPVFEMEIPFEKVAGVCLTSATRYKIEKRHIDDERGKRVFFPVWQVGLRFKDGTRIIIDEREEIERQKRLAEKLSKFIGCDLIEESGSLKQEGHSDNR